MKRSFKDSQEHKNLIWMMVEYFTNQGLENIKADIPGMRIPDTIFGSLQNHKPDLTADFNGTSIIVEAETSSSIFDNHTSSQWMLFSEFAEEIKGEFHLVVPKGWRNVAIHRADSINVNIATIWTP
ncbi:MAG: hypothetical protein GF317_16475 [Candidatus Lokiarchaeota archaeon]|nr:hypothetical protein [Candidatus Lokiarchaeota archaeon]